MNIAIGVFVVALVLWGIATLLELVFRAGDSRGYAQGMDEASGWRDAKIEEYKVMLIEALNQRDQARAQAWNASPNTFARKDVN
jgi:hypothetical protein